MKAEAKEFLKEFKEKQFMPTVNFEGDLMASEAQIIELMEAYHQSRVDAVCITAHLTVQCGKCDEIIEINWERNLSEL